VRGGQLLGGVKNAPLGPTGVHERDEQRGRERRRRVAVVNSPRARPSVRRVGVVSGNGTATAGQDYTTTTGT
jgi:hypothetical protein